MSSAEALQVVVNGKPTDITDLKVAELKVELKKLGISTAGNKAELLDKLRKGLLNESIQSANDSMQSNSFNSPSKNGQLEQLQMNCGSPNQRATRGSPLKMNQQQTNDLSLQQQQEEQQRLVLQQQLALQQQQQLEQQKAQEAAILAEQQRQMAIAQEQERLRQEELVRQQQAQEALLKEQRLEEERKKQKQEEEEAEEKARQQKEKEAQLKREQLELEEKKEEAEQLELKRRQEEEERAKSAELPPPQAVATESSTADSTEDSHSERSESAVKEVPMSGDRNRFSRSKSPKARWQGEHGATDSQSSIETQASADKPAESAEASTTTKEREVTKQQAEGDSTKAEEDTATSNNGNGTGNDSSVPKVQRKRKWLSNDQAANASLLNSKKQLTISSDTLKAVIPNKDKVEESATAVADESVTPTAETDQKNRRVISANGDESTKRKVILEENSELIYEDALDNSTLSASGATGATAKSDEPAEKAPATEQSKIKASNVLHIRNLTRPFTVHQLKELLTKFGPLKANPTPKPVSSTGKADPHYFWINSVKSHCFVAFETEQEAELAQKGLHQITWPQSNPKKLYVEMASMDDMEFVIRHNDVPSARPQQNGSDKLVDSEPKGNKLSKELDLASETAKLAKSVREWDLPKMDQEAKRTVMATDSDVASRKKQRTEEEPPKTLDDLFRKTEVTPHIYWLPLTEEQFVQKEADFQKRQAEREVRMEARKLKEAEEAKAKEQRRQAHRDEAAAKPDSKDASADLKADSSFDAKKEPELVEDKRPKTFVKNGVIVEDIGIDMKRDAERNREGPREVKESDRDRNRDREREREREREAQRERDRQREKERERERERNRDRDRERERERERERDRRDRDRRKSPPGRADRRSPDRRNGDRDNRDRRPDTRRDGPSDRDRASGRTLAVQSRGDRDDARKGGARDSKPGRSHRSSSSSSSSRSRSSSSSSSGSSGSSSGSSSSGSSSSGTSRSSSRSSAGSRSNRKRKNSSGSERVRAKQRNGSDRRR